ncbi:hypothetical protein RSOLAG1IB_00989 [Rhizoctonia solani AG-1 IB]|uniref:Uncharacterized protein n=2 Tax=Rhizoctonia solani TaxID=456999 RepID=A0A8H2X6R9_9AGAM|nr:unnamed protein product [Rhizoctonia solani]CEL52448.1 hypothetical protein RSOLAG1IB_00989 [Rhizoctonia solani AG-1 IB]
MILELASDNPLHTLIRIPNSDSVIYRITSVQNLNHLSELQGWTTTLSVTDAIGSSVSKNKARRDVATIVWDHDGETVTMADSGGTIASHLVFDFQERSQRPLEIEVRDGLVWKGDISGLHLMQQGSSKETPVATLRPCRRFIHGRLVRKVMQRFDELDISDSVIDEIGLNTIIATFTVITTARQRRFGIVPRRVTVPNSSDSESAGSSVEYEDSDNEPLKSDNSEILEPNDSDYDSEYQSEDPDAPSPRYTPPGTSHGPPQTSYTFASSSRIPAADDDITPRANQTGFDNVLIVNPESRRPSAQSGVNTGFENDFNPNSDPVAGPTTVTSARTHAASKRHGKEKHKDKQKGDILGALPLPSALASLGLGIRSSRRRSAAEGSDESDERLKKWGRSRGLSF